MIPSVLLLPAMILSLGGGSVAGAQDTVTPPGFNTPIPKSIMTPDEVETSIGRLEFFDGMPTAKTVDAVYDNLDRIRGTEVFLNFIPAASLEGMRLGMERMGCSEPNECLMFKRLLDSTPLFLTGNTDTVYAAVVMDLEKHGPMVVEVPPKCGPGTVNDAFFRFVVDMGGPGPDRGQGGKYLILPPDQMTEIEAPIGGKLVSVDGEDYFAVRSPGYLNWLILRGLLVDGKPQAPVAMFEKGLKVYPYTDRNDPPAMKFIDGSQTSFNTIHANDSKFFEEIHTVLDREPNDLIDPELRGLAASIGLQKGKAFDPDARMKGILEDSVAIGNATARAIFLRPRDPSAFLYPGQQWYTPFVGGDYRWLIADGAGGRNLDARTLFFYCATVNTPAMALKMPGVGSQYALISTDSEGDYLDGSKNYTLRIPPDVPAKNFWSFVVYDPQTRSELQSGQLLPSKNSVRDSMKENADGSVTLYFGPESPKGVNATNWIQTVPGKGWFALLRLYGPLEPWFEKTWRPGDIELAD
ncbi:MAG: DUF1254 domain-containing protein [Phycisphaeraceae bacterium]|nr:DUF1254 domain-containing protein [Phycisphaeraceae bacterium]